MYGTFNPEFTIRYICDGLLNEARCKSHAVFLGIDMRVSTDPDNLEQRDVAVGVHLLRYQGRIIGAADPEWFLFPRFQKDLKWESISTHDSCWADSTMGYIYDVQRDIMEKQKESKYTGRYSDDNLTYAKEKFNCKVHYSLQTVNLMDVKDIFGVEFIDRHNDNRKRPLIDSFYADMLREDGLLPKETVPV